MRSELVEQRLHHPALAGLAGDQVDDEDRVVLLLVAVDAAHPLLEPRRVPGDVVVDHQPAELQVDPLARRVGGRPGNGTASRPGACGRTRPGPRAPVVHAAVDPGDLAGEAEPFEPPDEEVERVAVLGEDRSASRRGTAGPRRIFAQLVELRLVALGVHLRRQLAPGAAPGPAPPSVPRVRRPRRRRVPCPRRSRSPLRRPWASPRRRSFRRRRPRCRPGCRCMAASSSARHPARLDRLDEAVELGQATFEGTQQGVGRTGQPALEDAHSEPGGGAVQDAGAVVEVCRCSRSSRRRGSAR